MKKKKETEHRRLDDVDVFFDPKPLTEDDHAFLSEFILKMKQDERRKAIARKRKQAA